MRQELVALGRRLAASTRPAQGLPRQVEDAEVLDLFTDLATRPLGRTSTASGKEAG